MTLGAIWAILTVFPVIQYDVKISTNMTVPEIHTKMFPNIGTVNFDSGTLLVEQHFLLKNCLKHVFNKIKSFPMILPSQINSNYIT